MKPKANVREQKQATNKLIQDTKKMQQQLEQIRKYKQLQATKKVLEEERRREAEEAARAAEIVEINKMAGKQAAKIKAKTDSLVKKHEMMLASLKKAGVDVQPSALTSDNPTTVSKPSVPASRGRSSVRPPIKKQQTNNILSAGDIFGMPKKSVQPTEEPGNEGSDLGYFLSLMKLDKFQEVFQAEGIKTLQKLRNTKKQKFDELGVSFKEQVKIIKKLRDMGVQ